MENIKKKPMDSNSTTSINAVRCGMVGWGEVRYGLVWKTTSIAEHQTSAISSIR